MASTSMTLGEVWTKYLKEQVESGEYASASEVVREALRAHKNQHDKLVALRAQLSEGRAQLARGDIAELPTAEEVIAEAKARKAKNGA